MTNWDSMTLNCCEKDMYDLKSEKNDGDNNYLRAKLHIFDKRVLIPWVAMKGLVADHGKLRRSTNHRFNMTIHHGFCDHWIPAGN